MSGTGGLSPEVARWFARRTSVSDQWCRKRLVEAKGRTRVSVVLPARNEAPTVGAIVTALRRELMEDLPLIDELVVIDSQSTDATAEVAARAGARVVSQGDALPRMGDVPGKGEALWKSLLVTDGDIVAFIDADLRRFDAQFAVALLGPLLSNRDVGFVKAFYDRPLAAGTTLMPAGGGRVTELVARPLLNEHWPVLAGIIQPLAGEYAARRQLLEQLPFVSGYGVEIAMLIDVVERWGLAAMAQVDLGCREHRNSDDAALGQMAAQVQLAVLSRLRSHDKAVFTSKPGDMLTQFERQGETFVPRTTYVGVTERPPMAQIAEYRRRVTREPV